MMKYVAAISILIIVAGSVFFLPYSHAQNPEKFGNHVMTQVGIVVNDVEEMAKNYASILNMPVPDVIITDTYEKAHTQYEGKPTRARAKLAFFRLENITIELIEPMSEPSTWQAFLEHHGEGVHHLAFRVEGMEQNIAYLENHGARLIQQGDFTGGSYAYIDLTGRLGVILELLTSTN